VSKRGKTPSGRREAGIALLLVVWLLALLTVIGGEFMASGRVRAVAERNRRDDLRALALAMAGYRAAVAALDDRINGHSLTADGQLLLHYQGEAEGVPATAADVPLGDGTYSWRISDEDGLVDINQAPRAVLANLLQKCGLEAGAERDTIIDSILDWRDSGREHRLNGAEEDYYRSLDPPYSSKDGDLDVVEELLLVRGMTPEIFTVGEVEGLTRPGLRSLVTAYSSGTFNAGTAPQAVLEALGTARPQRPTPPSLSYAIVATGRPGGGAPARSLKAVVSRDAQAGRRTFSLVYWNDSYIPE
jgi:general secretion pathway protein K